MNGKEEAMVNTVVAHLDGLCKYCFTNRKLEEKCLKNLKPFFYQYVVWICWVNQSSYMHAWVQLSFNSHSVLKLQGRFYIIFVALRILFFQYLHTFIINWTCCTISYKVIWWTEDINRYLNTGRNFFWVFALFKRI